MQNITFLWNSILGRVPDVIAAVIILVLAYLTAWVTKKLVIKLMKIVKFEKLFEKTGAKEGGEKALEFIGKLAYLIVFILFLPGIFGKLGLDGISTPIMSMMSIFMTYLPNILATIIILIIGLFLAKIVKELLKPIFENLKIDKGLQKLGIEVKEGKTIAEALVNIIYVLILIPIVIAALNSLNISAISEPAISMLNKVFNFIPNVIIAIVIIFAGRFISKIVFALLESVLKSIGIDTITKKVFETTGTKENKNVSLANIIANIVKYVVIILFVVQAINILNLDFLTVICAEIVAYLPYALSTIVILGAAFLLGNYLEKIIVNKFPNNKVLALITKVVVITISIFVSLYQLGIAKAMINSAFIIILGALAVAFAISFGIGGREFAAHVLKRLEEKIEKK